MCAFLYVDGDAVFVGDDVIVLVCDLVDVEVSFCVGGDVGWVFWCVCVFVFLVMGKCL